MNSLTEHLEAMIEEDQPAPGFLPMPRAGFVAQCTGLYYHPETAVMAARIRPEHLNPLGIAHGGFLATLADTAFGRTLRIRSGIDQPPATINLSMDYLSPAKLGTWVEARVEVHRLGRTLSHASLDLLDGERLVARGKATFVSNTPSLHGKDQKA